jgi:hypothetical protein
LFRTVAPVAPVVPTPNDSKAAFGTEIRIAKMIEHLKEIAGAQITAPTIGEARWGLLVLILATFVVDAIIVGLLGAVVPPAILVGVSLGLVILSIVFLCSVQKKSLRATQDKQAKPRENLEARIQVFSQTYPNEVQAWGGSNVLHDPELVDKLLTGLRAQRR